MWKLIDERHQGRSHGSEVVRQVAELVRAEGTGKITPRLTGPDQLPSPRASCHSEPDCGRGFPCVLHRAGLTYSYPRRSPRSSSFPSLARRRSRRHAWSGVSEHSSAASVRVHPLSSASKTRTDRDSRRRRRQQSDRRPVMTAIPPSSIDWTVKTSALATSSNREQHSWVVRSASADSRSIILRVSAFGRRLHVKHRSPCSGAVIAER